MGFVVESCRQLQGLLLPGRHRCWFVVVPDLCGTADTLSSVSRGRLVLRLLSALTHSAAGQSASVIPVTAWGFGC